MRSQIKYISLFSAELLKYYLRIVWCFISREYCLVSPDIQDNVLDVSDVLHGENTPFCVSASLTLDIKSSFKTFTIICLHKKWI